MPGAVVDGLEAKFDFARRAGFDGIELRARGNAHFAGRLPELRAAARAGVVMPTVCPETDHFIGDFDAKLRRDQPSGRDDTVVCPRCAMPAVPRTARACRSPRTATLRDAPSAQRPAPRMAAISRARRATAVRALRADLPGQ
jgi:hypothetical protein